MFDFFNWVADFFSLIWNLISNIFNSIFTMLEVVYSFVTLPLSFTGFLPPIIYVSFTIVFSVSIVKLIIGWSNQ